MRIQGSTKKGTMNTGTLEVLNVGEGDIRITFNGDDPGARPCQIEWIESGIKECREAGVAPFTKQLGSNPQWNHIVPGCSVREKIEPLKLLHKKGDDPLEWPWELRVQEFP